MKISTQTLNLLKNFSSINASILVQKGSALKTISPQSNIMASAVIDEEFESPFAIYDLSQFLAAVSLFEDPDFTFGSNYVTISTDKRSVKYFFADPSMVKAAGEKSIKLPSTEVEFDITDKQLAEILKAANILQVPEITVVSDGESKTRVQAANSKNASSNSFDVEVDHESDTKFRLVFKSENLKMIAGDYKVQISSRGIARFFNEKLNVEYFIAIESSSKFGG